MLLRGVSEVAFEGFEGVLEEGFRGVFRRRVLGDHGENLPMAENKH